MSVRAHYVRLFVLLALLLPLYAAVQLWLLSEPATRVEVRTVTEQVPVEVPVDRVVLVPAPSAAQSIDEAENQPDEESGSELPLLLAIPGLLLLTGDAPGSPESRAQSEDGASEGTPAEASAQAEDTSDLEPIVENQPAPAAPPPLVASPAARPTPPIAAVQPAPIPPPIAENPRPSSSSATTAVLVPGPIVAISPPSNPPALPVLISPPPAPAASSLIAAVAPEPAAAEPQRRTRSADADQETERPSDRRIGKGEAKIQTEDESTNAREDEPRKADARIVGQAQTQPNGEVAAPSSKADAARPAASASESIQANPPPQDNRHTGATTPASQPPAPTPSPNREKHPTTTPADAGKQATVPARSNGNVQQPKPAGSGSTGSGSKGKGR
jgi:hypothetical protein